MAGGALLRWAIALSVTVHALAALTVASRGWSRGDEPWPARVALSVRWTTPASAQPIVATDPTPAPPAAVPEFAALPPAASDHGGTKSPMPRAQPEAGAPLLDAVVPPAPPEAPVAAEADGAAPPAADVDGYLPRKLLTQPPRPLADITMHWPPGTLPLGRRVGLFTLFIDETGKVRKMVPDDRSLPPPLEEAAREVFAAAPFAPGELDGRPMKSIIRIEVVFESTAATAGAAPAATPVVVSRQNL